MLFVLFGVALFAIWWFSKKQFPVPPNPSAVLISGAGTGFGRLTSLELAQLGYTVYSGVMNAEEGDALIQDFNKIASAGSKKGKIIPVVLDITKKEQVDALFERLNKDLAQTGLQGLINNAGIGWSAPFEIQPYEDFRKVIEVNLLGHVLMTKTFLPLLRKATAARIINLASAAGVLGVPRMSAYAASKFAIEGFSDCIRRELRHLNIAVSVIECGFAKTPILNSDFDTYHNRVYSSAPPELIELYSPVTPKNMEHYRDHVEKGAIEPILVVNAIVNAFTSTHPLTRYRIGIQVMGASILTTFLPNYAVDWVLEKVNARINQRA